VKRIAKTGLGLALVLTGWCVGCSSSKRAAKSRATEELQRKYSAVADMNIVVAAGVTKLEYSGRLTDALLKFGNDDGDCTSVVAQLPAKEEQATAADVCQHLGKAMEAYTDAKEYFGPKPEPDDTEILTATLTEQEYDQTKKRFPNLDELPIAETNPAGYKFYARNAMVQALWKVAKQESDAAKSGLEKLAAP
jgi:hypothetical protein